MQNPNSYYEKHLEIYQQKASQLQKKTFNLSMLRLVVFIATVIGIYFSFGNWQVVAVLALIGIIAFVYLLLRYNHFKREGMYYKALVDINIEELKIASGEYQDRYEGLKYQDSNHYYSFDIDLFGRGSFFQFINRTTIPEGTNKMAELLKANNIENIRLKQEAIKELKDKPEWRQYYAAKSSLIAVNKPTNTIVNWLNNHKSFLPEIMRWLPWAFSLAFVTISILTVLDVISNREILLYLLFVGLGITGKYLKKINNLARQADKVQETFRQYADLLDLIEKETFKTQLLIEKQKQIQSEKNKASLIFKKFVRALDALDNRNNLIGAIFGNGWFLTDLRNTMRIEKWIEDYAHTVENWFEAVSFFDAMNSLGNYAFNHPDNVFPKIVANEFVIKAHDLGHPLINKEKCVNSNLHIQNEQFFIVTGANMAGKSTFLRTVSMHIVMANIGLPVCASSSEYKPIKLITSMRTTDSLKDESSYFFSELSRLKFIVEAIEKETYFIVLDEILKGTNSTDKAIGSKKFVEKLVFSNATGIIATHDLSLCEIEKELDDVKNYYFDAQIVNDELYFDYKLKKGICQNMNASFLLKKMNIV